MVHSNLICFMCICFFICIFNISVFYRIYVPICNSEINQSLFISDSSAYAHYVFNTFDHDRNGSISFEVFISIHLVGIGLIFYHSLQGRQLL